MKSSLKDEVLGLQLNLGKKATFEDAVKKLTSITVTEYREADPAARTAIDSAVARVATLLQTRYSGEASRGFWTAGAVLFEAAAKVSNGAQEKMKVQKYLAKAHEFLGEDEVPRTAAASTSQPRFLFEGQLSQDPPPMRRPDAQALFSSMFGHFVDGDLLMQPPEATTRETPSDDMSQQSEEASQTPVQTTQESTIANTPSASTSGNPSEPQPPTEGRPSQEGSNNQESVNQGLDNQGLASQGTQTEETGAGSASEERALELPEWAEVLRAPSGGLLDQLQGNSPLDRPGIEGALARLQELIHAGNGGVFPGLEEALQASLEEAGQWTKQRPAAAKDEVERLPVMNVDEAKLKHFGPGTQCAVCREDLAVGDKVQQMPCNHLFHPPCLAPWLEENNSCPICRYELRTDDNEYERRKEQEKQEDEDRRGAANAVREGQFMYM